MISDKLHLGCGLNAPQEWLNVDGSLQVAFARLPKLKKVLVRLRIYPQRSAEIPWSNNVMRLDLRKRLPFADNRFVAIYSSHALEHLHYNQAEKLLTECFRVLKRGGVCRIVVPDLAAAVHRYLQRSEENDDSAADEFMEELNVHLRINEPGVLGLYHFLVGFHRHKWMYDAFSLKSLLEKVGFTELSTPACKEGRLPGLQKIEEPGRILNGAGVIVEGVKP